MQSLQSVLASFLCVTMAIAQDPVTSLPDQFEDLSVEHANCTYFGADREKFTAEKIGAFRRSKLTAEVVAQLAPVTYTASAKETSRTATADRGLIDRHVLGELERQRVAPAPRTTDAEFIRRVSIDISGRIPTQQRVVEFLNDQSADKRAKLVDELLASNAYVDRWSMFFGDLYRNTQQNQNIRIFEPSRDAFHKWIQDSVRANKPYDQMARELIGAQGNDGFTKGELNFLILARVTGGPAQDIYDQQAANVADTFLGLSHLNCIGCHNGRGHLDDLSLWGRTAIRYEFYQLASHFSRTTVRSGLVNPGVDNNFRRYWLDDTGRTDYTLNTTSGNRPARQPSGGQGQFVAPLYPFSNKGPARGENYRVALGRELTADIQFARATVNYIWAQYFGRGLVEPLNQFDPARLDPDNPPPAPWTLQASHPRLLNELAAEFQKNKFDLKWLMRAIANSDAYQLSSRYEGQWNPSWEPLLARHLAKRLSAEAVHDSIAVSSNVVPAYRIRRLTGDNYTATEFYTLNFAMQFPETRGMPPADATNTQGFLDTFLRGDRDQNDRKDEASSLQALNMMNDPFVMNRIRSTNVGGSASLLNRALSALSDDQMIDTLFLSVLSRYPSEAERTSARNSLRGTTGQTRMQRGENLLWTLYNKVDFLFNY